MAGAGAWEVRKAGGCLVVDVVRKAGGAAPGGG